MMMREWWPAFMADEMMPSPEATPSGWIREALGDTWLIAERAEDRESDASLRMDIASGETMDFIFCDRLPDVQIRVYADGSFELLAGTGEGANNFFLWDAPDFSGSTLDEVAGDLAEQAELGEVVICCHYWSDEIPHRLDIGGDGPHFVALVDVPAFVAPEPDLFGAGDE